MCNGITTVINKLKTANKKINIKLLGDSITHGVGGTGFKQDGEEFVEGFRRNPNGYCWANKFREYCEKNYNCTVTNNACTGTQLEFVIKNLDTLVSKDDDIVICTIGTNNRHVFESEQPKPSREEMMTYVYNLIIELYNKFKSAQKDVIFVANIPATSEGEKDGTQDGVVYWSILSMKDINDIYFKASCEYKFPFISMYNSFTRYCEQEKVQMSSLFFDALHPNDSGYDVIFKLILEELGI